MTRVHGTAVALDGVGVLIRGPSGSGKSDLALRLIDAGALLVADDQTELWLTERSVMMRAPLSIAGHLEVRGVGIARVPSLAQAPLRLVLDLVPPECVDRLPEWTSCEILGRTVHRLALAPFEASAVAKVRLALRGLVSSEPGSILAAP
jgi:serine kinase of HPr protein (carbohydrate metabolism regulator)